MKKGLIFGRGSILRDFYGANSISEGGIKCYEKELMINFNDVDWEYCDPEPNIGCNFQMKAEQYLDESSHENKFDYIVVDYSTHKLINFQDKHIVKIKKLLKKGGNFVFWQMDYCKYILNNFDSKELNNILNYTAMTNKSYCVKFDFSSIYLAQYGCSNFKQSEYDELLSNNCIFKFEFKDYQIINFKDPKQKIFSSKSEIYYYKNLVYVSK